MGQYFYLVNVDRKEAMCLGKLGSALYDTIGLLQYLARAPSPDGLGFWAGHRLITIGDYMKECPAGMLTEEEEDEMNEWLNEQDEKCNRNYFSFVVENYHTYRAKKRITAPDNSATCPSEFLCARGILGVISRKKESKLKTPAHSDQHCLVG